MANTNDYVPFGTANGALVETPAVWAADPVRLTGFVNGVADPAKANTAWRQASVLAAAIAQFTADYGSGNVVDDGNVANLENQFLAALRNAVTTTPAPGIPYEGADTSVTANALVVSTTIPTSSTLTAGQVFLIRKNNLTSTGALTLKNGSNNPFAVTRTDGTPCVNGDWPAYGIGLLEVVADPSTSALTFQLIAARPPFTSQQIAAIAQNTTSTTFNTPGSYSFTIPAGVVGVRIRMWGGGGGGGGAVNGSPGGAASAGGSGAYYERSFLVTPGGTIGGTIAAGGGSGTFSTNGGNGGSTTVVVNGTTYTAPGGNGGFSANPGTPGASSAGGALPTNGTGGTSGGAPGGAGIFSNNGTAAAYGGNGGTAPGPGGGFGGNGTGGGNGNPGSTPGGGGGGGGGTSGSNQLGGPGGSGTVTIEYSAGAF